MTIAALRALLDELQPEVRRPPAPQLRHRRPRPSQDTAMDTPTARPPETHEIRLALADLIAWAHQHTDPAVTADGEQALAAVNRLISRSQTDTELAQLNAEETELEARLAELRARQAELTPAKPKKTGAGRDYDPAVVRAWARETGREVTATGRVPNAVVDAWRAR